MKVVFCSSAIIKNKNGEILLMSRKQKDSFTNCWEFPGGKLKNNENFAVALFRELKEELNIKIDINKLSNYEFFKHQYRSFLLMMYVFEVTEWTGKIISKEGELLRWVSAKELKKAKLLPANTKVVNYFLK
jgi:8-oxo-dGTP diphosphatase|tara:strand:- start:62 stop:454 length:393 start_codon:yes stop_codon:yes gene_type:complete